MIDATRAQAAAIVEHRDTLAHEAAHAAAALILGLEVTDVFAPFTGPEELAAGDDSTQLGVARLTGAKAQRRELLISVLAGPLATAEPYWPPKWPLSAVALDGDEAAVQAEAKALQLDEASYAELVQDARNLVAAPLFTTLHREIVAALSEPPHILGADRLRQLYKSAAEAQMQHMTKAATVTTATDRGEFSAIAAAYTLDRSGDVIIPGAFAATIARWRASDKRLPVHWNHRGEASDIIGAIDPASMRETEAGLYVEGRLDLAESDVAREAWRSMKNGAVSLSFGYLTEHATTRADGVQELRRLDLFEISIVPAPANPDTRIIEMKSAAAQDYESVRRETREQLLDLLSATKGMPDPQRKRAEAVAREVEESGPVRLAVFEA